VDSSVPETHPELAGGLFRILAALHNLKSQLQSGFDYLLTLTLGSLLVIVKKSKVGAFFFFFKKKKGILADGYVDDVIDHVTDLEP
jgi:hypothetical protein